MKGNATPYSGEDRSCRGIHSFCAGRNRRMRVLIEDYIAKGIRSGAKQE